MQTENLALLAYVFITTFTPGPNNISSASMGLNFGYKKTLPYMSGIFTGFTIIMMVCALSSVTLLSKIPEFEWIMAWVGALYISWLAYHTLKANYSFSENRQKPLGYIKGLLLQVLNPKVIIYGMTLYSTFLKDMDRRIPGLLLSSLFFAFISFCSISVWTLFGNFIRINMNRRGFKSFINLTLSLLLLFTAYNISGLPQLL